MKKWILFLFFFIAIVTGAIYLFIPTRQTLSYDATVNCTQNAVDRIMLDKNRMHSWWPGQKKDSLIFTYRNADYRVYKILLNGIELSVFNGKDSVKGMLQIMPSAGNTTGLQWVLPVAFSTNPLKRVLQYRSYSGIKDNIESLLTDIKKYFDREENIYGMTVTQQKIGESSMIALKQTFSHYPSILEIYGMINSVKGYIEKNGGKENNFPMLSVHSEDSAVYEVMVAIPTIESLSSENNFILKKMRMGNILMAEVKGNMTAIKKGEQELENYVADHSKNSPAIPFQSLVTNRLVETDSSKWITRLYYPIF